MTKRYGMLYGDGSMNICPDGQDLARARKELEASQDDGDTELVEVELKITQMFGPKQVRQALEHSVTCPVCNTEVPVMSHEGNQP
ncbi:hypothetical protein [Zavarzinella formosa]|uniref:hypothetical protein n=1 Tax=Zavarzinella formosa TaxID=360055 RepID=UPI00031BDD79|nr:hypothetical protein [Zavarzinella formosa]